MTRMQIIGREEPPPSPVEPEVSVALIGQRWAPKYGPKKAAYLLEDYGPMEGVQDVVVTMSKGEAPALKLPVTDLLLFYDFVSGPKDWEDELLFIAEREIALVPEGMNPERWKMVVAAAKEEAIVVDGSRFQSTLRLLRQLAPLFTRPM